MFHPVGLVTQGSLLLVLHTASSMAVVRLSFGDRFHLYSRPFPLWQLSHEPSNVNIGMNLPALTLLLDTLPLLVLLQVPRSK